MNTQDFARCPPGLRDTAYDNTAAVRDSARSWLCSMRAASCC